MKVHMMRKDGKTMCNRDRYFGKNRSKELYIKMPKKFVEDFKRDSSTCCDKCVKAQNAMVTQK